MIEIASANINSFARNPAQSENQEPILSITLGQLQDLIREAVESAVAPLQERLDRLEALQEVYHGPAPQVDEIPMYRDAWDKKRTVMDSLPTRVWGIEQDLSELEKTATKPKAAEPTQKTLDHLTEIAMILGNMERRLTEGPQESRIYLARLKREGMTFSQLAARMNLTTDRIRQLSRIAATDQRFNISWHPRKKNTKIIKLRRWDVQNLSNV